MVCEIVKNKQIKTAPLTHEFHLYEQGYTRIGGIDEVGRGCIAGSIVVCAIIMPKGVTIPGVTDSKKLSPKSREWLATEIKEVAIAYKVAFCASTLIDLNGIQQATFWAMQEAIKGLQGQPDALLADGKPLKWKLSHTLPCEYIVRGDSLSHSIAAASIVAKVERDAYMCEMHEMYPKYGFNQHKGYGTRLHFETIEKYGLCPLHRRSFLKKELKWDKEIDKV